ncbi:MAG: low-specificity L-threonine aldolase [Pseudomonadales bacterium]|nr:low-specificity L-threonine aldolase [Pseudomonadales bacterium]MBO6566983.1 low-specificity L-threonine aldolase [Pseudomonadales bacterium]MBO6595277.1 low-specificity L-threonine aldolase [Pseudomonadales bacterium]MBO6655828.1 low-specificity L-threonine aldolase [Pseudomonadales bacterium]MBO6821164.1 low-specificity L-threonine aldolase [Pseudomonadales bacterium]
MRMIDLRSDTVTRPSAEMLACMTSAETGDDVYGEDPTVNRLEALAAEMAGKESGLFVTSGTQGNLLALLAHCQRGDEYIAGHEAHTYKFEGGGAAVLGGIQPQPVAFNECGELPLTDIEAVIKPDDVHFARTRLLCLENTTAGKVLSMDYLAAFSAFADERGLAKHLDGARVFNAAVKLALPVSDIAQHFDSVSICLSKGLATPAGSVLVGSRSLIDEARKWRKMVGGGMRQAGVIAAAGIYALEHHIDRLAEDHDSASRFAEGVSQLERISVKPPETNMVMVETDKFAELSRFLAENDVRVSSPRFVFHRDIASSDVEILIDLVRRFDQNA